jgi:autotransporter-associated beta strand protein
MFSRRRRSQRNSVRAIPRTYIEALESRRLLAADVWTGAGGDTAFTDAANWQGDAVPTTGQDVTFPAGVNNTTVTVDGATTVGSIEFDASYTISGMGAITLNGNIAATSGDSLINNAIVLTQTTNINVSTSSSLSLNVIGDAGNAFGITEAGTGSLFLQGPGDTYTGATTVQAGTLTSTTTLTSAVNVLSGANFVGSGSVQSLTGTGAQFNIAADTGAGAGTLTVANNLTFSPINPSGINFNIGGPGASSEITVTAGTISLGSATLSGTTINDYVPTTGSVITLIANNTGNPISGTFANLPEGASVTVGSEVYTISYVGGAGNDVTLTAQAATVVTGATVTLTSSHTPIFEGHTVHLTATVSGTGGTPTGFVEFFENFTPIQVSQTRFGGANYEVALSNGVANLDVSSLPVGSDTITASYIPTGDSSATATSAVPLIVNVRSGTEPTAVAENPFLSTRGYTVAEVVDASDSAPAGNDGLVYSWTAIRLPPGAKQPVYDVNNSNLADAVTVRFSKDGGYALQCTVTNLAGNSAFVDVDVTVTQKATTLRVVPHKAQVGARKTLQYVTTVLDQFNRPMRTAQPLLTYSVTAGAVSGSINSTTGLFSATAIAGPVSIEVADDKLTAMVGATVL